MTEQKAMAYVNMYGILGALENLCEIDTVAKEALEKMKKPTAICFKVKDGPCCTYRFDKNGCKMTEGEAGSNCKMNFSSPEKFNDFINSAKPGVPTKGIIRTFSFLLGTFTALTDRLNEILRPSEEAMRDRSFFEENTILTMYVVAGAVAALANHDSISKISAAHTPDGDVMLGIKDTAYVTVQIRNNRFALVKAPCEKPRALMEFSDIDLANGLFAGTVSTMNELCKGNIRISGMASMVDNINRILDRVSVYLS